MWQELPDTIARRHGGHPEGRGQHPKAHSNRGQSARHTPAVAQRKDSLGKLHRVLGEDRAARVHVHANDDGTPEDAGGDAVTHPAVVYVVTAGATGGQGLRAAPPLHVYSNTVTPTHAARVQRLVAAPEHDAVGEVGKGRGCTGCAGAQASG